ncbi:acetyl-CoA carboxylase biotin carboxyl carrier protein [Vagococcus carniphilus]|uniref:Biotin carboxyl carrier protein of acetyl-CoA carboxylase n=1 Tax=Vagococcus carniphilus TaxID=218144 RepID=A0A430AYU9_9ENTE|nr:acetyl-CoA carboxylase biotin carboxyl carrier protein [Vagococcus carniphilus]QNN72051.1 acetyl-CoA carboxylase biotin carboxyl carrier protein [Vagococcus carniphilus]RSU13214.1 acetyl-CoA carboxylase, biotin carboxyl carrier protein [Vagococcus carniphilus]
MNFSEIKELLELFESSSIREMDLKKEDLSLYLNKNEMSRQVVTETQATPKIEKTQPSEAEAPVKETVAVTEQPTEAQGETVNAPIVGVIYTASDPSAPAFVQVGDKVSVGDTLCIIEAMKIMNEVKSDVAGTVTEILIENEDVVEFGQALFRIS